MESETPLAVRAADLADAPAVASLLGELGYPSSEEQARERLVAAADDGAVVLLAEQGGRVVGLIAARRAPYFPDGSLQMRITAMVVATSHRRRGVGRTLIDAVTHLAVEQGCSALELTTAERRTEAHRFYESLGFARASLRFLRRLS